VEGECLTLYRPVKNDPVKFKRNPSDISNVGDDFTLREQRIAMNTLQITEFYRKNLFELLRIFFYMIRFSPSLRLVESSHK